MLYTKEGQPVRLSLYCPRCGERHPLKTFGLRMLKAKGEVRNQPYCGPCRGAPRPSYEGAVEP
jgi:hypothetical protein